MEDYLFRLSVAQIQFMSVDNTHIKHLQGKDKKIWENYKAACKAQRQFDSFMGGLDVPDLAEGEEYEIPVKRK